MSANPQSTPAAERPPVPDANDLVVLDPDHPGFRDPVYRERRNAIAQIALSYRPPDVVPTVRYESHEQMVWRTVWEHLSPVHKVFACREYHECSAELKLPHTEIPQLRDVNIDLKRLSGFQMVPVSGLVTSRSFLGHLGRDYFLSTQYLRHHSVPLYTPEPDLVHELVGHAATLAHPGFAELNREFGAAAERASEDALTKIERVYWFTLEFGLVQEPQGVKAYGAGLLSSFGELGRYEKEAKLLPFDIAKMIEKPYDPTQYQNTLYVAPSFDEVVKRVKAWLHEIAPP